MDKLNEKELNKKLLEQYKKALVIKSQTMKELIQEIRGFQLRLEMTVREIDYIEKEIKKLEESK